MTKIRFAFNSGSTKSLTECEGVRERLSECEHLHFEIHPSGVASCVNPFESSCSYAIESVCDVVGLLIKKITRVVILISPTKVYSGPVRESNPGPLAPKARIMPLDQQAKLS